ncbi:PQQ-dependent sugar dehydrogenase [Aeoliella sp.]|uniref:PQQ-dependent sugar dehydrogenase n=1 Tax=Aeoliella sp. TaxID=2795800 RepID=UPI003CCBB837
MRLIFAAICVAALPTVAWAEYTVQRVASGLNQPIHMTQAPGDGNTLYIVERNDGGNQVGRVIAYDQLTGQQSTFLDLPGTIISDGGLLSLTFHPDYQQNGQFYTVSNAAGTNGLDEWKLVGGEPVFQRRLLEYQNLQNVFHTMNVAMFRPGGNNDELFVVTGDGGTQANSGQFDPALIESEQSPYGKLLRVDLSEDFTEPANDPTAAGVDVMALGLRNPYRASFDRATGDMYIADVGFNAVEEVNFVPASHFTTPASPLDFGWTSREGTIETITSNPNVGGPKQPGDIDPIFEYAHNSSVEDMLDHDSVLFGGSITGGYVYRGPIAELQGRYYFADFTAGRMYSGVFDPATPVANYDGDNLTDIQRHDIVYENMVQGGATINWTTSFAEDNVGNLYMVKFGNGFFPPLGEGEVFRLVNNPLEVTIDRQTGSITLENNNSSNIAIEQLAISSEAGAVDVDSLTPITGFYDAAGNMQVDDDAWMATSETSELYLEQTTGDAGSIASGAVLSLSSSGGWIQSPYEDLRVAVQLADGSVTTAVVSYVGDPLLTGDLDGDGHVSRLDFELLAANAYTDLGPLTPAESYRAGDMNGDGLNDYADFRLFKNAYIDYHGAEAFARLLAVPEPHAIILLGGLAILGGIGRRRSIR